MGSMMRQLRRRVEEYHGRRTLRRRRRGGPNIAPATRQKPPGMTLGGAPPQPPIPEPVRRWWDRWRWVRRILDTFRRRGG